MLRTAVMVDVFPDATGLDTLAGATTVAVDEDLGSKVDLGPSVAAVDGEAVVQRAGGAVRPA